MQHDRAREVATWMSKAADKYNSSIITVIAEFEKAADEINDIELAKIRVVKVLSENK